MLAQSPACLMSSNDKPISLINSAPARLSECIPVLPPAIPDFSNRDFRNFNSTPYVNGHNLVPRRNIKAGASGPKPGVACRWFQRRETAHIGDPIAVTTGTTCTRCMYWIVLLLDMLISSPHSRNWSAPRRKKWPEELFRLSGTRLLFRNKDLKPKTKAAHIHLSLSSAKFTADAILKSCVMVSVGRAGAGSPSILRTPDIVVQNSNSDLSPEMSCP